MPVKFKVKKGDNVVVTTGRDKGLSGKVSLVLRKENKVVVSGVNLRKKHEKPSSTSAGGVVAKELPIQLSNVAILDPKENVATKVGYKFLADGKKVRFAKKSGEVLDN
jgi:large subunit ribosomal protein L24